MRVCAYVRFRDFTYFWKRVPSLPSSYRSQTYKVHFYLNQKDFDRVIPSVTSRVLNQIGVGPNVESWEDREGGSPRVTVGETTGPSRV